MSDLINYIAVYCWIALGITLLTLNAKTNVEYQSMTPSRRSWLNAFIVVFSPLVFLLSIIISIYYAKERNT